MDTVGDRGLWTEVVGTSEERTTNDILVLLTVCRPLTLGISERDHFLLVDMKRTLTAVPFQLEVAMNQTCIQPEVETWRLRRPPYFTAAASRSALYASAHNPRPEPNQTLPQGWLDCFRGRQLTTPRQQRLKDSRLVENQKIQGDWHGLADERRQTGEDRTSYARLSARNVDGQERLPV